MNKEHIGGSNTVEIEDGKLKVIVMDHFGFKVVRLSVEECRRLNDYAQRFQQEQMKPKYTTRDGLLFKDGIELGVGEADRVARENGCVYAEEYVAFLESKDKEPKV